MLTNPVQVFERSKHSTETNEEFWTSRNLAKILEYTDYRNFELVVKKAKQSCKNSGQSVKKHFVDTTEMITLGRTASRELSDIRLSRYACYLIMQNADPSKEIVALGQTYFAIQTRRQEIHQELVEDQKRIFLRGEITAHNKHLSEAASIAGVKNYGLFTNYGYKGLYGGLDMQGIQKMKKLKKSQQILDHMCSEELAANLFRATQTDAKIRREKIHGEAVANQTHFEVGRKVRQTIREIGGIMPEQLPSSDNINKVKTRIKKLR